MKAAEARLRDDLTHLGRLDGPVIRSVLLESEMKAVLVVPGLELPKQPPRMTLTRHDDVIEKFAANGPDEALGAAVHLWGANRGLDGTDAEIPDPAGELVPIRLVAVSDQESGRRVPGEGVDGLLAEPESGWVCRHVREDKAPAFECQDNEDVKNLEPIVGTVNRSTATMPFAWLRREVLQV